MSTKQPAYYEFEQFRRATNRKIYLLVAVLAFATLASMVVTFASVNRPLPVVIFDAEGKPVVFEDTRRPALEVSHARVLYFSEQFIKKYVGVDSTRLESNLHDALNLMTPKLRAQVIHRGVAAQRAATYRNSGVRTRFSDLEIKVGPYDERAYTAPIYIYAWSEMVFEPIQGMRIDDDTSAVHRYMFATMQLDRASIDRTKITDTRFNPFGLNVAYVEYVMFETQKELDDEILARQQ